MDSPSLLCFSVYSTQQHPIFFHVHPTQFISFYSDNNSSQQIYNLIPFSAPSLTVCTLHALSTSFMSTAISISPDNCYKVILKWYSFVRNILSVHSMASFEWGQAFAMTCFYKVNKDFRTGCFTLVPTDKIVLSMCKKPPFSNGTGDCKGNCHESPLQGVHNRWKRGKRLVILCSFQKHFTTAIITVDYLSSLHRTEWRAC